MSCRSLPYYGESPPPLAVIRNYEFKVIEPRGFEEFSIRHSEVKQIRL